MGEIKKPSATAQAGNPVCGDIMKIYLKIVKDKRGEEVIKDIKFQTLGCAAAIATSSMMTEMVKGKRLDEALKISDKAIAEALGGLPPIKMHCSMLAREVLEKAINDYKTKMKKTKELKESGN